VVSAVVGQLHMVEIRQQLDNITKMMEAKDDADLTTLVVEFDHLCKVFPRLPQEDIEEQRLFDLKLDQALTEV